MKNQSIRFARLSALSMSLVASAATAQFPSHFGNSCGGATLAHSGDAIPGGSIVVDVTNIPQSSIADVLAIGLNRLQVPVPLALVGISGGCELLVDAFGYLTLGGQGGQATVTLPIATSFSSNVDVHFRALSVTPTGILGSDGLTVPIDSTPPAITGVSASSGSNLSMITVQGQFDRNAEDHCLAFQGGLGIITGGNANQLNVEVQAVGATATGPVMILEGKRDRLPASTFIPLPGAPAPQSMAVFTGTPSPATMSASRQNFTVRATPGFRRFGASSSSASTITYSFAGGCQAGDCLRVWMRIYENGKCHDVYFTENGQWAGKSIPIPGNMSGNFCALWACAIITQSLAPRIPGLQCNVVGDSIEITVNNGTGITGFEGGFWISGPPC